MSDISFINYTITQRLTEIYNNDFIWKEYGKSNEY